MLLRIRGLGVSYGATMAVDGVDLDVEPGEVHALVGENGAGKSTLLRVVAGVLRPRSGSCEVGGGVRVAWAPQEPSLAAELTAAEWIFLGRERHGGLGLLRLAEMEAESARALGAIGSGVSPRTRLAELSPAARKQVQLARALAGEPELLLLDEPSAVLASSEVEILFAVLRRRRERGLSTVYVTHRLDEVRAVADRVTVLRDGRRVSTDSVSTVGTEELVRRMVGREVVARAPRRRRLGEVALRAHAVTVGRLREVSFSLRRGEIVGLAGLVGAGRSEVLEAVAGLAPVEHGRLERLAAPRLVPEDRGAKGLIPTFCLRENVFLPVEGWLRRERERRETRRWIADLGIRGGGPETAITSLSGGNQQKVVLARALRRSPTLLLLDEPTAGVDVGAKAEIHQLIGRLADAGTAILLASSDLPELLQLCDRILALRGGRIVGEVSGTEASEAGVAAWITGAEVGGA